MPTQFKPGQTFVTKGGGQFYKCVDIEITHTTTYSVEQDKIVRAVSSKEALFVKLLNDAGQNPIKLPVHVQNALIPWAPIKKALNGVKLAEVRDSFGDADGCRMVVGRWSHDCLHQIALHAILLPLLINP